MANLGTITVKVDTTTIEPVLEKLYSRIVELREENEKLKDALDEAQERITDLEGLQLHS